MQITIDLSERQYAELVALTEENNRLHREQGLDVFLTPETFATRVVIENLDLNESELDPTPEEQEALRNQT
jgi:hypothetical protein